jgi:anti-anti-sigma factor
MFIEIKQNEEVCFLRCEGRFVAGTDPEYLCAKRHEIKRLNCKKVLADFSEVSDFGSAGIGFIVGVYTFTRDSGGRFILVGLRPRVRDRHARQHGYSLSCGCLVWAGDAAR